MKSELKFLQFSDSNQSDDGRHGVDCVQQVFQQSFDHVDDLEALEICVSNMIQ